jgi:hypothetical protein
MNWDLPPLVVFRLFLRRYLIYPHPNTGINFIEPVGFHLLILPVQRLPLFPAPE